MNPRCLIALLGITLALAPAARGDGTTDVVTTGLTLPRAIELALDQNAEVLKAHQELRRTHGIIVEVRAQALPQLIASGTYRRIDEGFIDVFPGSGARPTGNQLEPWSAEVEASQLLYSGGRVSAAVRAARLADHIALLDFRRVVADVVLEVRLAFYETLLNAELVGVREQSVHLLQQQLIDVRHRFEAGTVPHFNVLRAEVERANAQPPLIRARNNLRLSKERLVKLLALERAERPGDFTSLTVAGELRDEGDTWQLADALRRALAERPELQRAAKQVALNRENIRVARAGYQPEFSAFAGYGIRNSLFSDRTDENIHGWTVGARATWNLFDGLLTKGKVDQARAELAQAELDLADQRRTIELEVRQAYSDYVQARELIQAQVKTVEQAEEGLRLAEARFRTGTGTQLDVLSAQTALTEARSNTVQALYDYNTAVARLERAAGMLAPVSPVP
ncbi:TolC family protein [bacterium]|nr:TolC family protein [bacterium]